MRRLFFLLLAFCFLQGAYSTQITCDDSLATGSLWTLGLSFDGGFDKATVSLDSAEVIKIYYNSSDKTIIVNENYIDKSSVNSYSLLPDSVKFALYPLSEGDHVLKVSTFKDANLLEDNTKNLEFISSTSLISDIKKIGSITDEISAVKVELDQMAADGNATKADLLTLSDRLESVGNEVIVMQGAMRQNSKDISSLQKLSEEVSSINQDVSDLSAKVNSDSVKKDSGNGLFSVAFAVLGGSALPIVIVIIIIAVIFVFLYIKSKKEGGVYGDLEYPGSK